MSGKKSNRRYDVLEALRKNERASIRELCEMTGIKAWSQVHMHLLQLEAEGLIQIDHRKARGLHVCDVSKGSQKADWRKCASLLPDQVEKRRQAGRAGRGENALTPKKQHKLDEKARIDEVVRKAHESEMHGNGSDPLRENRSLWSTHATKIG